MIEKMIVLEDWLYRCKPRIGFRTTHHRSLALKFKREE